MDLKKLYFIFLHFNNGEAIIMWLMFQPRAAYQYLNLNISL